MHICAPFLKRICIYYIHVYRECVDQINLFLVGNKYPTFYVHIEGCVTLIYLLLLLFLCFLVYPWPSPSFHQEKMDDAQTHIKPML
jgi:hypothetical protein